MLPVRPFEARKVILGMIHLAPLPGTPFYDEGSFDQTRDTAIRSARALAAGGADGCLVQTVDRVYSVKDESDPARTIAMALIVRAIADEVDDTFHVGAQLMRNAVCASLAVAKVAGGRFIRAGAIVGRTLTAHGIVEASPLAVSAYRRKIDAGDVTVIGDVASMHYKWVGDPTPVGAVAKYAKAAGADAVALCDRDEGTTLDMIGSVRALAPELPIFLAGYTNHQNAARLLAVADGAFVGTCIESDRGRVDVDRVKAYVEIVRRLER